MVFGSFAGSSTVRGRRRCDRSLQCGINQYSEGYGALLRKGDLHLKCRKAYLSSYMVKKTMTGGSGVLIAVPLPRLPTMIEVALLPEKRVVEVEKAVERRLRLALSAKDALLPLNDRGLVTEALLCIGLRGSVPGGSVGTGRLCGCHICNMPLPDLCGLDEPIMSQETFFLSYHQMEEEVRTGRRTFDGGHDIRLRLAVGFGRLENLCQYSCNWRNLSGVPSALHKYCHRRSWT